MVTGSARAVGQLAPGSLGGFRRCFGVAGRSLFACAVRLAVALAAARAAAAACAAGRLGAITALARLSFSDGLPGFLFRIAIPRLCGGILGRLLGSQNDALIMLSMLKVILIRNAVARGMGITSERLLLVAYLMRRPADLHIRPVTFQCAVEIVGRLAPSASASALHGVPSASVHICFQPYPQLFVTAY